MRLLKNVLAIAVLGAALSLSAQNCYAQDPFTKLGRGAANTLTGWAELPNNIGKISAEENIFSGVTKGLAQGFGMALARTGAGIYEIVSFPVPVPDGYESVIDPEYVF